MTDWYRKCNLAWSLGKEKWFVNSDPGNINWSFPHLGESPMNLNYTMFQLTLEAMMTDEQLKKWSPLQKHSRILGGYAQTEIGHGSDVSGLETTATLDLKTDEFVIHTPTKNATKWWPGDIGLHCTHTIVYAQLVIEGQKFGVMPFMVQLRDCDTFMPMKGVTLGDMGPKFGYGSKNNGWCAFESVRIPREQMLMKYTAVDKDGTFSIEGDTRVLYSVMMNIRLQLIQYSGQALTEAL